MFQARPGDGLDRILMFILDIEGNSGGNFSCAVAIARHFIIGHFPDLPGQKTNYDRKTDSYALYSIASPNHLGIGEITAPVVVLQNHTTTSVAEHFLDFMSYAQNAVSVGTESAGGTGDPASAVLPGGGSIRLSNNKITHGDGTPFLNIGIQPDIYVENTIQDYINGRNKIFERGLAELMRMCNQAE